MNEKEEKIFFLIHYTDIPCKGQPEANYSKFSFKQYFPFQHEYLTLDLTEIHEKKFSCPNEEGVATNFHMAMTALLNYKKDSNFEL